MMANIGKVLAMVVALITISGALFGVAAHYQTVEAAEKSEKELKVLVELKFLQGQLDRHRDRLSFLTNKENPTKDDRNEIAYLRGQINTTADAIRALQTPET